MNKLYQLLISLLFLLLLPLGLVIAVGIALFGGFPILYLQRRVGKNGKTFVIYKFRSMFRDAEKQQKVLMHRNEARGPVFKIRDDPRLTTIGKFLNHTGLDELPQLYNVLRGDMALIGPRPLPVAEAKKLAPWMQKRHTVLPGIISPAILSGKYHENFKAWMHSDIEYAGIKHIYGDLWLVCRSLIFLWNLMRSELGRSLRDAQPGGIVEP